MNKERSADDLVSPRYSFLEEQLRTHPLNDAIHTERNLRIFMEHHVYAVWDFMSLIKALQIHLAPARVPWQPSENSRFAHFINQLVLEEESDFALTTTQNVTHASHFESYRDAMSEVGANTCAVSRFIQMVADEGLESAMQLPDTPAPAKRFMAFTFDIIKRNQLHLLAAVLAYGRESVVPGLFRSLAEGLKNNASGASILYAYLERHVQLDEQEHGPLAVLMVQELCADSVEKKAAMLAVAEQALVVRLNFWDGIYNSLSV